MKPSLLIVGLGNPGASYERTRHNVGFQVVEELARRWGISADHLECNSLVGGGADGRPWLARPQTYMNRSGAAVRLLADLEGFDREQALALGLDPDFTVLTREADFADSIRTRRSST